MQQLRPHSLPYVRQRHDTHLDASMRLQSIRVEIVAVPHLDARPMMVVPIQLQLIDVSGMPSLLQPMWPVVRMRLRDEREVELAGSAKRVMDLPYHSSWVTISHVYGAGEASAKTSHVVVVVEGMSHRISVDCSMTTTILLLRMRIVVGGVVLRFDFGPYVCEDDS